MFMLSSLPSATLSDLLGYTSIACWLGAQFPQVLENIRRQSVEGLALPFLLNWLLGDLTNLIGCILTHQLPFQTYLATYFCFVDFSLLSQYWYYRRKFTPLPPGPPSRPRTSSYLSRRYAAEHSAAHYRSISNVAANVAAAAAIAAHSQGSDDHGSIQPPASLSPPLRNVRKFWEDPVANEGQDEDEGDLGPLADSFHSEGGGGRAGRFKRVSWSNERRGESVGRSLSQSQTNISSQPVHHPSLQFTDFAVDSTWTSTPRGRSLQRSADQLEDGAADDGEDVQWRDSGSAQRRSSRASRRGASIVFLGVWALIGVGSLAGSRRGSMVERGASVGRILSWSDLSSSVPIAVLSEEEYRYPTSSYPTDAGLVPTTTDESPPAEPSTEFVIGRISAWTCTTLYLTSRLPQIWKNFVRKSVQGLSMYLFIFAFLGNFFYVASILTSPNLSSEQPPAERFAFIRESIPYILGSGGTLIFDVTIVAQSFIYRNPPHSHAHARRRSSKTGTVTEEEGLLSAHSRDPENAPAWVGQRKRVGSVSTDRSTSATVRDGTESRRH